MRRRLYDIKINDNGFESKIEGTDGYVHMDPDGDMGGSVDWDLLDDEEIDDIERTVKEYLFTKR